MTAFEDRNAPIRAWVDGTEIAAVDVCDRGLAYGDGLFETFRVIDDRPLWWEAHFQRLSRGAERLGIRLGDSTRMHIEAMNCCEGAQDGVLKLIITRGSSGRGYRPGDGAPTRIVSLHRAPFRRDSLRAMRCHTALGIQPLLAGIKHLNRLEQVLAAQECAQAGVDEGLLFDTEGRLVSAVSGNVFVQMGERLLTPPLTRCGIAGLCRDWLLQHCPEAEIVELGNDDLIAADGLLVCNSVRGILPVANLDGRDFAPSALIASLIKQLRTEIPALPVQPAIPKNTLSESR